jgi:hypothetical protein
MLQQFPVLSTQYPDFERQRFADYWQLGTGYCYAVSQMWGAYRWAARFLLLVMLAPAAAPMAMSCAALPKATHCIRQPMSGHPAQPAMPCHHAMAQSKPPRPESAETSFRGADSCCQNHCCCGATTSEWARSASSLPSFISLTIESARPSQNAVLPSSDISRQDSARAPPL